VRISRFWRIPIDQLKGADIRDLSGGAGVSDAAHGDDSLDAAQVVSTQIPI